MQNRPLTSSHGFTLVELLIVLGIIAVLIGLPIVSYNRSLKESRDIVRKLNLQTINASLEKYQTIQSRYPPNLTVLETYGFIDVLPDDPLANKENLQSEYQYQYEYNAADDTFELSVPLEQGGIYVVTPQGDTVKEEE